MAKDFKIGIYDDEEKFISSVKFLIGQNVSVYEVFTPYPVGEVFHLLKRKSRLPLAAYFFGIFGIMATLGFLYYTSVINWPLVYGGKPFNSFPSFVVVTIVITIFTVTILSLALFSARSKLIPGRDNTIFDRGATDNKFVIVIEAEEAGGPDALSIMKENGAVEVIDRKFDNVTA